MQLIRYEKNRKSFYSSEFYYFEDLTFPDTNLDLKIVINQDANLYFDGMNSETFRFIENEDTHYLYLRFIGHYLAGKYFIDPWMAMCRIHEGSQYPFEEGCTYIITLGKKLNSVSYNETFFKLDLSTPFKDIKELGIKK